MNTSLSNSNLLPQHLRTLQDESGLNIETIQKAQLYSADAQQLQQLLKRTDIHCAGIVFPYLHTAERAPYEFNVRLDDPVKRGDGEARYLRPAGSDNRLYIPFGVDDILRNAKMPLIVTEGEKKALAAVQHGFYAVAVGGVWNWLQKPRDENGNKVKDAPGQPIADLDLIVWRGRIVHLVFDSDVTTKPEVRAALWALRCELVRRGAKPHFVSLADGGEAA